MLVANALVWPSAFVVPTPPRRGRAESLLHQRQEPMSAPRADGERVLPAALTGFRSTPGSGPALALWPTFGCGSLIRTRSSVRLPASITRLWTRGLPSFRTWGTVARPGTYPQRGAPKFNRLRLDDQ